MGKRSAEKILRRAKKLEERASMPGNTDDPTWLLRHAGYMTAYALRRKKNRMDKVEGRRKERRTSRGDS
jgi:hypothetical protein